MQMDREGIFLCVCVVCFPGFIVWWVEYVCDVVFNASGNGKAVRAWLGVGNWYLCVWLCLVEMWRVLGDVCKVVGAAVWGRKGV